jgi:hypothetical protein
MIIIFLVKKFYGKGIKRFRKKYLTGVTGIKKVPGFAQGLLL